MTTQEMIEKCKEFKEYKAMIEELENLASTIATELKEELISEGTSKKIAGPFKISYSEALRTDIDKKLLQVNHPDLYNEYQRQTQYMRFSIS